MVDHRERMLAVVRGDVPEGLLFVPRLDIWHNRNSQRGTLPAGYAGLSARQVAARLGVGFHAVVPDFIRSASAEDVCHRALGFYNNPEFPYVADFSGVEFEVARTENELAVVYRTRLGDVTTRCAYGRRLFESGSSIPDVTEYAVKTREDYAKVADIFSRVRILPAPEGYARRRAAVGTDGIAVAYLSLACGPMHHILRDLRKYEEFCLDLYDEPALVAACAEPLGALYEGLLAAAGRSPAEVVLFGANYDDTITWPPFFRTHLAPWLARATDAMRAAGKYLMTHTDGENRGLLPIFGECRFDIADSVCPAPMTKVPLAEYRRVFAGRTTIWGGIPSSAVVPACCPEEEFRALVRGVVEGCRPYDRLILSVADTTPPDADFGRIEYLAEVCAKTRGA